MKNVCLKLLEVRLGLLQ